MVSCLSNRHFNISKWVSFTYGLGASQGGVFAVGPRVGESVFKPFKRRFSIPYSPLGFLHNFVGFQSLAFRGLAHSFHAGSMSWVTDVEHKLLTPQGKVPYFGDPS